MGWARHRHLPPSLRLLGAELEERSLLEGSELVVLVFACCFSCSCSCAAIFLPLSSPLQEQIRISCFLLPPLLLGLRLLPEKNQIFAHARRDRRREGEEKQMQIRRESEDEKRGERKRVCVRDGNGRTEEVGGDRNGGRRWGWGVWMRRHPRRARHRHPTAGAVEAWRGAAPYTPPPHLTATS